MGGQHVHGGLLPGATSDYERLCYLLLHDVGLHQLRVCTIRGVVLDKAWAYFFHIHRAAHRTNYSQIGIIRAINRYCVHPTLRRLKLLFATVSMNGR